MQKKQKIIAAGAIISLTAAYLLISPIWRDKTLNEPLPSASSIEDKLGTMDADTRADLNAEVKAMKDKLITADEPMPAGPTTLSMAEFKPQAHEVAGKALLVQVGDKKIIRFEDFDSTNGPDLRIYLSAGLNNKDYVDLGAIKATKGNINYVLPAGTDTAKYNKVLVWCRAFSVLFSYAEL